MENLKRQVAELADQLYAGEITHKQFREAIPLDALDTPQIGEIVDMILHEPHVGWFFGVNEEQGQKNRAEIIQRIAELRHVQDGPTA